MKRVMILALAFASIGSSQVGAMRGLRDIDVAVTLEKGCRNVLSSDVLRTSLELKARTAGVKIVDRDGEGSLLASLECLPVKNENRVFGHAISVSLEFSQPALLIKLSDITAVGIIPEAHKAPVLATTWERGGLSLCYYDSCDQQVKAIIGEFVDRFLNDFLKANEH